MLTIILKILSIVGMILLVLLGIALLLLLLVLFFPVTYRLEAERYPARAGETEVQGQETAFQTKIRLKANWLFGLIRVRFYYPEPGKLKVKVLWISLAGQDGAKSSISGAAAPAPAGTEEPSRDAKDDTAREAAAGEPENMQGEQKKGFFTKIKCTFYSMCDKIKKIASDISFYKEQLLCDDTRGLVDHVFRRLGKILKSIRPRKLKADIRFGTGAPDTTGYALGVYGMLSPHLSRKINITPDFAERVLEGRIMAAGHICAVHFLRHGVMVLLDRRLRQLTRKLKSRDADENSKKRG